MTEDVECGRRRPNSGSMPGSAGVVGQRRRLVVSCGVVHGHWQQLSVVATLCVVVSRHRHTSGRSATVSRGPRNSSSVHTSVHTEHVTSCIYPTKLLYCRKICYTSLHSAEINEKKKQTPNYWLRKKCNKNGYRLCPKVLKAV